MKFFTQSKKVGEIELFRFIFAVSVLLLHAYFMFDDKRYVMPSGAFGVEFFFLVSGFLMMMSLDRMSGRPINNLGKETATFVFSKVKAFFPEFAVSFVIGFFVMVVLGNKPITAMASFISKAFFEFFLISRTGMGALVVNSVTWYLQSMLLAMAVLYPFIRKFPKMMKWLVMPLIILGLLGWLSQNYNNLRNPTKWLGFAYKGNIRAVAELCLGAECYFVAKWLKRLNLKTIAKVFLTLVKWVAWISVIGYMALCESKFEYDFFFLAILCVAVVLAFSKQCVDTKIYNNVLFEFLGKLSLPLYLSHVYYARTLAKVLPESLGVLEKFLVYLAISFITASVVMFLGGYIRRQTPKIMNLLKRIALK